MLTVFSPHTVMTSLLSTLLPCTFWAVWHASVGHRSPAGALWVQTVTNSRPSAPPITPPAANHSAAKPQEALEPHPQSASGQWTPSCCLPRSTGWNIHRCTPAKTTGVWKSKQMNVCFSYVTKPVCSLKSSKIKNIRLTNSTNVAWAANLNKSKND